MIRTPLRKVVLWACCEHVSRQATRHARHMTCSHWSELGTISAKSNCAQQTGHSCGGFGVGVGFGAATGIGAGAATGPGAGSAAAARGGSAGGRSAAWMSKRARFLFAAI